jgi:hypothetical protein
MPDAPGLSDGNDAGMNTSSASSESRAGSELSLVLVRERAATIATALEAIQLSRTRYDVAGPEETSRRLNALYDQLCSAVAHRDLSSIVAFARELAEERFVSGYDLSDVQRAFNAVEEAVWATLCRQLQAEDLPFALGLIGTVLGAAKDALSREYVERASQTHVPSLDLSALFAS